MNLLTLNNASINALVHVVKYIECGKEIPRHSKTKLVAPISAYAARLLC